MRLRWRGEWQTVPGYTVPPCGELVAIEATRPLAGSPAPSGRMIKHPARKLWRFLLTDGPVQTYRKARSKHDEKRLIGDYRVAAVLGERVTDRTRVAGLACRVPPCADYLPLHKDLIVPVNPDLSEAEFDSICDRLVEDQSELEAFGGQSYLYSNLAPPPSLRRLLQRAVAAVDELRVRARSRAAHSRAALLTPPQGRSEADSILALIPGEGDGRRLRVALLGAGDYARTQVLPALKRADLDLHVIADREPQLAAEVGRSAGFRLATTDAELAIDELSASGLVVVATAHDSHARLASSALDAGHRVFLEKPAVVTEPDLSLLVNAWERSPRMLELGFNRRHNRLVKRARDLVAREAGPTSVFCIVREIPILGNHWYFWPNQGTRIAGNLCHWIDLGVFLIGEDADPERVSLSPPLPGVGSGPYGDGERVLTVTFSDGSLLTVAATDRGDDLRGVQETVEIRRGFTTVTLDDLWKLRVTSGGRVRRSRTLWRNKGHEAMFAAFLARAKAGLPATYPLRDLVVTSSIQIAATRLLREGGSVALDGGVRPSTAPISPGAA
jgi:predicted dehydrogenase